MHLPYWKLAAISAGILSSVPSVLAITAADIPNHTPVSQLLASADSHLSQGQTADALEYYDAAISRDPQNFLTYFKRGATYLSLGRTSQARSDFDKVLSIKPGFQGALLQRAKIYAGLGDWDAAKRDYEDAAHEGSETAGVKEAEEAAGKAVQAEASGDLEGCITQASAALLVANRNLALRQLRVGCRLARGEVQEAISDLLHVLQLQPGLTFPHMQISAMQFFALGDRERGLAQIRKCLHSDPDSKDCMKLLRREKVIEKELTKAEKALEKKQFATALKYLVKNGEDAGLLEEIKTAVAEMKTNGVIPDKAPNEFYTYIAEMACQCSQEINSQKTQALCDDVLKYDEHSLHGLLWKAHKLSESEEYDAAIRVLTTANEHHEGNQKIQNRLREAQIKLRQSKTKDYYKVLGLPRDADELQIKSAYRKKTKEHHPDKAVRLGVPKEEAEKKMAAINEAYEVLSDPELKARFDAGDDPNDNERGGHPGHGNPFAGHAQHPFGAGAGGQKFHFQSHGGRGGQQFQFKFPGGQGGFPFG